MAFKVVFQFDIPKGGWSETWYLPNTSEWDAAKVAADNYSAVRASILGKFATLEASRITKLDPPRTSIVRGQNIPGSLATADAADTPWQAFYGNIKDQSGKYQRISLFRGVPDALISRDLNGNYNLPSVGNLFNRFNAMLASLRGNGFAFRARSAEGVNGVEVDVASFSLDPQGYLQFTSAIGTVAGMKVTFKGGTGDTDKILKGSHTIRVVQGALYTTTSKVGVGANVDDLGGWTVRRKVTAEFLVGGGELIRPAHRDTGRPFGLGRGRQSAKR